MIFEHIKTQRQYRIVSEKAKIQIDGEWVNAVIYESIDEPVGLYFTRSRADFFAKFKRVVPTIENESNSSRES